MTPPSEWLDANRAYLLAALATVRAALERYAAARDGRDHPPPVECASPPAGGFALDVVVDRFGLSPFERSVLLLAAGPELEGRFEALLAAAHGDPRTHPTFGLALAALPDAHWSATTPSGPLRRWRLLEIGPGGGLMSSPLRIDERVLHFLVGAPHPDERLRGIAVPVEGGARLAGNRARLASALARRWDQGRVQGRPPVLSLHGGAPELRRDVAVEVAAAVGSNLIAVRGDSLPAAADERADLVRLLERECALSGAVLLLERGEHGADAPVERAIEDALTMLGIPVILSAEHAARAAARDVVIAEVPAMSYEERLEAWHDVLGVGADDLNGALDRVAGQFRIGRTVVHAIGSELRAQDATVDAAERSARLWSLCRMHARPRLEGLAQRIEPAATWDDLVLPPAQLDALRSIALHVRHRALVHHRWGFARRDTRGLGIAALFSGASGTGKTMAAEVLANELALDLHRIDLSQVVSKYIGETEKNLRKVFDAAESGSAVLLFDEADALFGKRSEVKDSHDRYANIEVSYLLQRMEGYHGLAILTTNVATAIDQAFLRRLRFSVTFPFPDARLRAEIWRGIFPPDTPTEGLDPVRLSRLTVTGGNIRNIALHAAFLAAEAREPVRMPHLLRAARVEYAKLDRPLTDAELGGLT
jgi:hypothetical protein